MEKILKLISSTILFCFVALPCFATILTITYTNEQPNTTIRSSRWNQDMSDIQNFLNGNNLDSTDNIKAGGISTAALANGAVTNAKLSAITGAGLISGAAFTSLSSTPSGAGIIPTVNLGSGSPGAGNILIGNGIWGDVPAQALSNGPTLQIAQANSSTVSSTNAVVSDNTAAFTTSIGAQIITEPITPIATTDILKIDACVTGTMSATSLGVAIGIMQDATTNAIATFGAEPRDANTPFTACHSHYMIANTISETTFKARAAVTNGAGTFYNNGNTSSVALFGGETATQLIITEYKK